MDRITSASFDAVAHLFPSPIFFSLSFSLPLSLLFLTYQRVDKARDTGKGIVVGRLSRDGCVSKQHGQGYSVSMISMPSCSILRQPLLRKGGVDVVSCGRENVTYTMPGHGSFVVFLLFLVRGNGSLSPVTWRSNGVRRDLWPGVSSRVESPRGGGILHRVTEVEFHRSANEAIKWHDFHIDRDLSSNSLRKMSEYTCLQGE